VQPAPSQKKAANAVLTVTTSTGATIRSPVGGKTRDAGHG
jgi:hypothetical protein